MTIIHEPIWDDAPRSSLQGVVRHLIAFFAFVGWNIRIGVSTLFCFWSIIFRRNSRIAFVHQLYNVGIKTLPVISVVALFIGMILALQVGLELRRFNQEELLGSGVMISLIREMGPFSCGVCLAACVGSAIAAELGTMKVNDEIDALEIMSISPIRFLAAPRLFALIVIAPILGFYCCVVGTMGGGIVASTQLGVDFRQYLASALSNAFVKDLIIGLLKATIFGLLIGVISIAQGFATTRGAVGVGRSTQRSVVISFLFILMIGYIVTRIAYR